MQLVRVYTGDDGRSHFEDITVDLDDQGPRGLISKLWPGNGVQFREVGGDYAIDFHNAPRRQLVVNLTGSVELEVGDGTTRVLGPGSILLAEDTDGQGHISRAVNGEPRTCLFVHLDDDPADAIETSRSERPGENLSATKIDLAAAVRRLGEAVVTRAVEPALAAKLAASVAALADRVEASPERTKIEAIRAYPGHQRIVQYLTTGRWPAPPADGEPIPFDALSFVGGAANPFSIGARYRRDGDEAVATVTFTRSYEGPPQRAHGGAIASVFDEVMSALFRALGTASAFTGTLTVRFEAPAPLGVEIEVRARLAATEGRKHTVEAAATGPEGRFATATATFVELSPDAMLAQAQAGAGEPDQRSPLAGTGSGPQSGSGA
jgi:acyl-coenzyme A thioesterase PaaI-like protein